MPFIAIALIIAATVGGGTALAAENALPGDPLWGVKVGVDERLAGMLATNSQAQAEQDVADIKTRVAEAEQLQIKGQLNTEAQDEISANLDAHAQDAAQLIASMQSSGNAEGAATVAADFQAAMSQGAASLGSAEVATNASTTSSTSAHSLLTDVDTTLNEASALSADASTAAAAKANTGF